MLQPSEISHFLVWSAPSAAAPAVVPRLWDRPARKQRGSRALQKPSGFGGHHITCCICQGSGAMTPEGFHDTGTQDIRNTVCPGTRNLLPSSPGDIAMGTSQGEGHLFGATLGTACSGAKRWLKRGIPYQLSTFRQLALVLEPWWHSPLKTVEI